jgi:hypothetical protein
MPQQASGRVDTVNRFLQMNISKEIELQQIVELAAKICDVPIAMITFIDSDTQYIKFKVGTDIIEVPFQDTLCQHTLAKQELLVIPDAAVDERVMDNAFVRSGPRVRFYAGSPLTTHDDLNFGTLCVYDLQPNVLNSTQQKMLNRLAKQVTRLLEFDASFQLLKQQYESLRLEETKLRSFVESSSSCHLLLDTALEVLAFNGAMVNALKDRYQLEIAEGMQVTEFVEPAFIEDFVKNCNLALLGELVVIETFINSPMGEVPWHLTFEPAFDATGAIIGVTYIATDITETVKHEKTVKDQRESLRQIDRIIAADLYQPMMVIKDAVAGIKVQGYPEDLIEFSLLETVCEELWEKGAFVITPENVALIPDAN